MVYVIVKQSSDIQNLISQNNEIVIPANNKFNSTALCLVYKMNDSLGGIRKSNIQDELNLLEEVKHLSLIQNISDVSIQKEIINYVNLAIISLEEWQKNANDDEKIPYSEDILSMIWEQSQKGYNEKDSSFAFAQIENIFKNILSILHQRGDRNVLNSLTKFSPNISDLYFAARLGDSNERLERAYGIMDKNYNVSLDLTDKLKKQRLHELLNFILEDSHIPHHNFYVSEMPLEELERNLSLVKKDILNVQKNTNFKAAYNLPLFIIDEINQLNESKQTLNALRQINNGLKGMIIKVIKSMKGMANIDFCIDYSIIDRYYSNVLNSLYASISLLEEDLKMSDADSYQIKIASEAISELKQMKSSLQSAPPFYLKKRMFDLSLKAVSCFKKTEDANPSINMLATFLDIYALGDEYRKILNQEYIIRENGKASSTDINNEKIFLDKLLDTPLNLPEFDTNNLSARDRFNEIDTSLNKHLNLLIEGNMTSQKAYNAKRVLSLFFQMAKLMLSEENEDAKKYLNSISELLNELTPDTEKQITSQIIQKLRDNPHETPLNILVMVDNMTATVENDLLAKFEEKYIGSISGKNTAKGGHFIQVATRKNHSFDMHGQLFKMIKPNDVVIAVFEYGKTKFILNPSPEKVQEMFAKDAERQIQLKELNELPVSPIIIETNNDYKFTFNVGKPEVGVSPLEYLKKNIIPVMEKAKTKGLLSYGLVRSEILFETVPILKNLLFKNFSTFQNSNLYLDFLKMQVKAYKLLLESVNNNEKVVIRTWDLAEDKSMLGLNASEIFAQMDPKKINKASLPEGIDFCLTDEGLPLFKDQLKCLLQAAFESKINSGNLYILFPKISNVGQLYNTLDIYLEVKNEFLIEFSANQSLYHSVEEKLKIIKLGVMIETNEAKMDPNQFKDIHPIENISFFSIGSNDLNSDVMSMFINQKVNRVENNPFASYASGIQLPTVRAIIQILNSQINQKAPFNIGLCGELGGDVHFIALMAALNKIKNNLSANSPFYLSKDIWKYFVLSLDPGWNPETGIDKINEVIYYLKMFDTLAKTSFEENKLLEELIQIINEFSVFNEALHDPKLTPKAYKKEIDNYDELMEDLYNILIKIIDYWNESLPNFLKHNSSAIYPSYQDILKIAA